MTHQQPPPPTNSLVSALLTDLYQITMAYAYWKTGKQDDDAVFELFFRKNPFKGKFTIFCGLDECIKYVSAFSFEPDDIEYLKSVPSLKNCESGFFDYLANLDTSQLTMHALKEGTIAFPSEPLIILEGPLGLCQLIETALLNLVNFPSLIATNAARMVHRAGDGKCIEFGLRRAQGPDGACSASKYSYVGGFVATSNVQAGKVFDIPIAGTHAHAFVQSFTSLDEVRDVVLVNKKTGKVEQLLPHVLKYHDSAKDTNEGELAAFVAYAAAFPDSLLCLIDTYNTIESGLVNFLSVAQAIDDMGYQPRGIRLDSGDLRQLSLECARQFAVMAQSRPSFANVDVVASNDINEETLADLQTSPHGISAFGIGTNLVTCQAQPALGCVYKLVEWKGHPRIKVSQEKAKMTYPGKKRAYRCYQPDIDNGISQPIGDVLLMLDETPGPECADEAVLTLKDSTDFRPLHVPIFDCGKLVASIPSLKESRTYVRQQLAEMNPRVFDNDSDYKYSMVRSKKLCALLDSVLHAETHQND